jgi:hypothetical protein
MGHEPVDEIKTDIAEDGFSARRAPVRTKERFQWDEYRAQNHEPSAMSHQTCQQWIGVQLTQNFRHKKNLGSTSSALAVMGGWAEPFGPATLA